MPRAFCLTLYKSNRRKKLYRHSDFDELSITLKFLDSHVVKYNQFEPGFVGSLSIIDAIMFNEVDSVHDKLLTQYSLID